jgi:hypothetical protein
MLPGQVYYSFKISNGNIIAESEKIAPKGARPGTSRPLHALPLVSSRLRFDLHRIASALAVSVVIECPLRLREVRCRIVQEIGGRRVDHVNRLMVDLREMDVAEIVQQIVETPAM